MVKSIIGFLFDLLKQEPLNDHLQEGREPCTCGGRGRLGFGGVRKTQNRSRVEACGACFVVAGDDKEISCHPLHPSPVTI